MTTSHLATMQDSKRFGVLARLEAERRGIRQAEKVVVLGDGAAWIDTPHQEYFPRHVRIVDGYHASERLSDVGKAAPPENGSKQKPLDEKLTTALWEGQVQSVVMALEKLAEVAGPPREDDPLNHPRRVLHQNAGYFKRHAQHMNDPQYRRRGWPIGSGVVEAGVKQFNKRVKGTEQFRHTQGVEPILALRAMWLSEDERWNHYRWHHQPPRAAA